MNATTIAAEKLQPALPKEIWRLAGLQPGDLVEWRFENGEIHGRKIAYRAEVLDEDEIDAKTQLPREGRLTAEGIVNAVRVARDRSR